MIPPDLLLRAYSLGIFPMAEDGEIGWYSPDPRGIIPLDTFHIPHGLKRTLKKNLFRIRINSAFEEVMRACAKRKETWIDDEIRESYVNLHHLGYAHSVEAWQNDSLVGGLYGVSIGGAFFGESMFHTVTDASKVALCALVDRLNARGYTLLDTQWTTDHLRTFGAADLPAKVYQTKLKSALQQPCAFFHRLGHGAPGRCLRWFGK